jgi:hypothetical protein
VAWSLRPLRAGAPRAAMGAGRGDGKPHRPRTLASLVHTRVTLPAALALALCFFVFGRLTMTRMPVRHLCAGLAASRRCLCGGLLADNATTLFSRGFSVLTRVRALRRRRCRCSRVRRTRSTWLRLRMRRTSWR